ncbi:MAG: tetratricopeptide repeat protein [Bacillota bacterium]
MLRTCILLALCLIIFSNHAFVSENGNTIDAVEQQNKIAQYCENARDNIVAGNYRHAINFADRILAIDASNIQALNIRGQAYYWLGEYDSAIKDFSMLLAKDGANNDARYYRGCTYMEMKKYYVALGDFYVIVAADKTNAQAYIKLARLHNLLLQYSEALTDCEDALKIDPRAPGALLEKANAEYGLWEYEKASADYKSVLKINPESTEAQTKLAVVESILSTDDKKVIAKTDPKSKASVNYLEVGFDPLPAGVRVGLVHETELAPGFYAGARATAGFYTTLFYGLFPNTIASTRNNEITTDLVLGTLAVEGLAGIHIGDVDAYFGFGLGGFAASGMQNNNGWITSNSGCGFFYPKSVGVVWKMDTDKNKASKMVFEGIGVEVDNWSRNFVALDGIWQLLVVLRYGL